MNKSERLNDMLLYLKDKKTFRLKDIMHKYTISRSTALRDIRSLEALGMPLYSKTGRHGCYGILENRLLSPILFTTDEVQALYFSMQTLSAYQSTPFHLDIEKLKSKFESCLSKERINTLKSIEKVFNLGTPANPNTCLFLKTILETALHETPCKITYQKPNSEKTYYVQFFNITSAYGQWYAIAHNFPANRHQVFRCDKIQSIHPSKKYTPKPLSHFTNAPQNQFRHQNTIDFNIHLTPKGADIFHKENYPSMQLHAEDESFTIKGFYNPGEEHFIANYLLSYGDTITHIDPPQLKELLLQNLTRLQNHYQTLP